MIEEYLAVYRGTYTPRVTRVIALVAQLVYPVKLSLEHALTCQEPTTLTEREKDQLP